MQIEIWVSAVTGEVHWGNPITRARDGASIPLEIGGTNTFVYAPICLPVGARIQAIEYWHWRSSGSFKLRCWRNDISAGTRTLVGDPNIIVSSGTGRASRTDPNINHVLLTGNSYMLEWENVSGGNYFYGAKIICDVNGLPECVETIGELRALEAGAVACLTLLGYHARGDGGGGSFFWDSSFNLDLSLFPGGEDGGTVIRPNTLAPSKPGRWRRIFAGPISVRWFGAKGGGGPDDDTPAIIAAGNALQAAGGGTLYFPPGNYFIYKNGISYTQSPVELSNISGVKIEGWGATITIDPARSWTGASGAFIRAVNVHDLFIAGFFVNGAFTSATIATGIPNGPTAVVIQGDCKGLTIPYFRANGIVAPVVFTAPTTDTGSTNIWMGTIESVTSFYGVNSQNSGSNMVIENLVTNGVYRSLFIYGVKHVKAHVRSTNQVGPCDVPINTAPTAAPASAAKNVPLEDIEIWYTNHDTNSTPQGGAVGVFLAHGNGDVAASMIRDIRVHLDVRYAGSGQMGTAFAYVRAKLDGNLDNGVDRGHTLQRLIVDGLIDGTPVSPYLPIEFGWQHTGAWGAGENVYDITLRDLKIVNNTQASPIQLRNVMPALKGHLVLDNVEVTNAIDVLGSSDQATYAPTHANARFWVHGVRTTNLDAYVNSVIGLRVIQANAASVTVLNVHREHTLSNFGAGAMTTYTLPASVVGMEYSFVRVAAQTIRIDPNEADVIRGGGAGKYLSLDSNGAYIRLKSLIAGTWEVLDTVGTTSFEP